MGLTCFITREMADAMKAARMKVIEEYGTGMSDFSNQFLL